MLYWGILFSAFIVGYISQYKAVYSSIVVLNYKLCDSRSIHYFPFLVFLFLPITKKSQLDFRYIRDKETEIYFLIDKIKSL
mgnify:CR=1 FL=1